MSVGLRLAGRPLATRESTHHVKNDDGRDETDAKSGNETTNDDGGEGGRRKHLNNNSDHVDDAARDDGHATTEAVGEVTGDEGTEEGAGGQDGDDEGCGRGTDFGGVGAFDGADEDLGGEDTVDVSGVISEENTSERGENTTEKAVGRVSFVLPEGKAGSREDRTNSQQVSFEGDRSFDLVHVGGALDETHGDGDVHCRCRRRGGASGVVGGSD